MPTPTRRPLVLELARRAARSAATPSLWPVVEGELEEAVAERAHKGWAPWRRDAWATLQYLHIATRLFWERFRAWTADAGAPAGDWVIDLKQAARSLRARGMVTISVVATIALAVGATTTAFTVVDGVLLEPLPYPESDRLARIWQTTARWGEVPEPAFRSREERLAPLAPSYYDWLSAEIGFESLGAYVDAAYVLQGDAGAVALRGQEATSGLFEALRIPALFGRTLGPEDDVEGAPPVVVLSESFWRSHFVADRGALGSTLTLNGNPHTVVGVMPSGFTVPATSASWAMPGDRPVMWTPLTQEARRGWKNVSVLGRVADGVPVATASDRLSAAQGEMTAIYDDYQGAYAESLLDSVVGNVRATLWFLLAAVGLVLLVANVNIANVLAAAGVSRKREMAVRAALGAGSARLARALVTESGLLAAMGGLGGILISWLTLPLLLQFLPPTVPRQDAIGMSAGVLLFGIAVTATTALVSGLIPALSASRAQPQAALRASGRGHSSSGANRRIRSALVVTQLSLAFVLLVGAALLGNSYLRLWSVERGFETSGLVGMWVVPDDAEFSTSEEAELFALSLSDRLSELPGVHATVANHMPLSGIRSATEVYLERPSGAVEVIDRTVLTVVQDSYFEVLGVPILRGRGLRASDEREAPLVAVVSEGMASRYWPSEDAVGQRLRIFDDSTASVVVVGVAGDVKHRGLADAIEPTVYIPTSQSGRETNAAILRVRGDIGPAVESARSVVASLSPSTPVRRVFVLDDTISESVAIPRFRTALVLGLAGLAAMLALLGVYGVVAHMVAQDTRAIGVRMALGARSGDEVRRVLYGGLALGGAGVALGFVMALAVADTMSAFLFEVPPTDPLTYFIVVMCVLLVSTLAAYVPARRAATVQPATVLKGD